MKKYEVDSIMHLGRHLRDKSDNYLHASLLHSVNNSGVLFSLV